MRDISIVGLGRVGGALAIALDKAGARISCIVSRTPGNTDIILGEMKTAPKVLRPEELGSLPAGTVIIAVRDDQIAGVARSLAAEGPARGSLYLHTSGAKDSGILSPVREAGGKAGSMHPLVSISDSLLGSTRFADAFFCVEGDKDAESEAEDLARLLGGTPFTIPTERKALYHAAANMACGHIVALIDAAARALSFCGPDRDGSLEILMPLIRSTVENLRTQSPESALTGTFARADVETFLSHLEALESSVPDDILISYLLLGEMSLRLAARQSADRGKVAEMQEIIRKLGEA